MGQGIGRALVLDLMAIARGLGARWVEVTANQHVLAFCQKTGFALSHQVETPVALRHVPTVACVAMRH